MHVINTTVIVYSINIFHFIAFGALQIIENSSDSGTLMFQLSDGSWGTVCNNGFDWRAANVACKQLGYDYGDYTTW